MSDRVLTEKTEDELWRAYRKTGDDAIRNRLVKQYLPLVKYVAGKLAVGMPQNVEFDDLVSYGVIGLFDAIDKFDPDKHVKFKTYAVTRVRGSIFDQLRQLDWVPRSIRQKTRELEDAVRRLEAQLGRSATDREIARELGISERDFEKLILKISGTTVLSLNDVWYPGDDNDRMSIGDSIESPQNRNPDAIVEKQEIKRVIIEAINDLPDKEKKVLVLYYYEDLTLKEIGAVLGVTESRISQLHTKAIMRLRGRLTSVKRGIM
ncbi:MAG: RNA polymerase sigma factor WhiG [Spirochaetales bacterium]|nr:RNA polymerase sigma factor WhiG [Spirochaetales bacterium]